MELNRDQIIKALEHCIRDSTCEQCNLSPSTCYIQEDALALIKELTEEKERLRAEKKRGYWFTDYARQPMVVCSNCNLSNNYNRSKYCPHCGARMDGK